MTKPCKLCGRIHKRGEPKGGWADLTVPLSVPAGWGVKK